MFFYNPKSRRSIRIAQSKFNKFGRLWQFRRFDSTEMSKHMNVVFFFFFILFTLRIGGIAFFALADFGGIIVGKYSLGINKPYAESSHKPIGSRRHLIFLTMDKHGNLKLNGEKCHLDYIAELINYEELKDPQIQIALIIDKETKMKKVNELIFTIKGNRPRNLLFLTSALKSTNL